MTMFTPSDAGTRSASQPDKRPKKQSPKDGGVLTPSLDKTFADLMLKAPNADLNGPWMMKAENTADAGCVYRWGQYCWEYVHAEEGKGITAQWLDKHHPDKATSKTAKDLWNYACDRLRVMKPAPQYSSHHIIPTLGGYLDIQPDGTVQVLPPSPEYGVDYVIQATLGHKTDSACYTPNPVPSGSLFAHFLNTSLPDPKLRSVVQELCGQTLLPNNYGVAGWFVGQGANGKGVLMEVVEAIHRQACRLRLDRLSKNFALEPIVGASLVLVDEVANAKFDEELFKTLITGNGVDIDRKWDKPLRSYRPRAKWLISSNNVPHIADKSDGVWRRIVFVPWKVQIAEADRLPDLDKSIIANELHIVLDWLLEGAIRIVKRGRMLTEVELPASITSQKQIMRLESDSVLAWIDEEGIHHSPTDSTPNDEIYQAYWDWCDNAQRIPLGVEMFWKSLRNRFPDIETRQRREMVRGKSVRRRLSSISLKQEPVVAMPTARNYAEVVFDDELPF